MFNEFDEITREIYKKYKPALRYIGVSYFPFKLGIIKSKEKAVIYIPSDF